MAKDPCDADGPGCAVCISFCRIRVCVLWMSIRQSLSSASPSGSASEEDKVKNTCSQHIIVNTDNTPRTLIKTAK